MDMETSLKQREILIFHFRCNCSETHSTVSSVDEELEEASGEVEEEEEAAKEEVKEFRRLCRLDADFNVLKVFFASPRKWAPRIGQRCSCPGEGSA